MNIKISRIKFIKQINNYLLKNKHRIVSAELILPEHKLIELSSDGSRIYEPITSELLTITLKPKNG